MGKFCRKVHLARSGKRWLAFLMSVCLIGTMIPITARAETEAEGYVNGFCIGFKFDENGNWVKDTGSTTPCTHGDNCNGYEPAKRTTGEYDIDGDGDKDNQDVAYEISNAGQLYWFAGLVNGTLKDVTKDQSANAILTKTITVNQNVFTENGELNPELKAPRSWTPIGNYDYEYVGTFDGRGNEISGLYYDVTTSSESYVCAGLFGYVEGGGRVSNVGVADSYFSLKNSGGSVVGGVCGYNKGTIENCYNTGEVTGTAPNSNSFLIGGVCGYNGGPDEDGGVGKIINCHNTGKVTLVCGDEGYVGGVSGCNNSGGTIENCHNTGEP